MADCESEKTIHYEEDGWSVTLTRYVSMELGETVASWVEFPNGWYLHSDDADAEFTQDGAKTYLQRLKSVWMESPFWDGVRRAMEEKTAMTRPVICVETGGATGISKMRRGHTDVSPGISETVWHMSIRCAGFIPKGKERRNCIDHHQADRRAEFRSHEEPARLHQR